MDTVRVIAQSCGSDDQGLVIQLDVNHNFGLLHVVYRGLGI